jgi:hypothetical protein
LSGWGDTDEVRRCLGGGSGPAVHAEWWGRHLDCGRSAGGGRVGGGGLSEEDVEVADGDDSKSDSEMVHQDVWCLTAGVAHPMART